MPAYLYEALDTNGRTQKGRIQADSPRQARIALRERGLTPLHTQPLNETEGQQQRRRTLKTDALVLFTRRLSGLLMAGLNLERSLQALAEEADSPAERNLLGTLREHIHAGESLARALSHYPQDFDETFRAIAEAGEMSGQLPRAFERMAEDLESGLALRQKLVGASLYPAIVLALALAIVLLLMTYVVPQIAAVFTGTRRTLPLLTRMVMGASTALRTQGFWLLLGLALLIFAVPLALRRPAWRLLWDAKLLGLPILGRLLRDYSASRFAGTLSTLCAAGVPILQALRTAALTLGNHALRNDVLLATDLVREGASLGAALARHKRLPALLGAFARLGEQSGQLPEMLQRAAQQLHAEASRRATQFVTLLEPILVVVMGLVVLTIVLSVLLPTIELNQWVK